MHSPLRKRCRRLLKLNWAVNTCVKIVRVIELINYRSLMCLHQVHGADHNGPESRQQSNQSSTRNSSSPFNLFAVSICFDYPRQWLFFFLSESGNQCFHTSPVQWWLVNNKCQKEYSWQHSWCGHSKAAMCSRCAMQQEADLSDALPSIARYQ